MVVTSKKNGEPRRTVDFQRVNQSTLQEVHHTPSPFNLVSTVLAQTKKTVLDAWNCYHSLMLNPDHKDATTFITEWERYRYYRAPMGLTHQETHTPEDLTTSPVIVKGKCAALMTLCFGTIQLRLLSGTPSII